LLPVDSGVVIALVASIATSSAAYAAWRAAETSKKQLEMTAAQGRSQMYQAHWKAFNECLDEICKETSVSFYNRQELYSSVFPNNRRPDLEFRVTGSSQLDVWHDWFRELLRKSAMTAGFNEAHFSDWCHQYLTLSGSMCCSTLPRNEQQLLMGGQVPSGISTDNFKSLTFQLNEVLNRLSDFAFCEGRTGYMAQSVEFTTAMQALLNSSSSIYATDHTYGNAQA
jgi:hypothetical protein